MALPNILGKTRSEDGERWVYRFANGLVIHTDPFMRRDSGRVLPLGGPQDVLLNRLLHKPELVRGKIVVDAFAGSGVFGLMALKLGAVHVDFIDINPRAITFAGENCRRNGFNPDCYRILCSSVADCRILRRAHVVLANPPFVITPPGIEGTLTSAAGADGNVFLEMLLRRLDELLRPDGEAYVYVQQLVVDGEPLIARCLPALAPARHVDFTPIQEVVAPFEHYRSGYLQRFASQADCVEAWDKAMRRAYGDGLGVQHYVMRIQPTGEHVTSNWSIKDNLETEYGEGFAYPVSMLPDIALGRVAENFILPENWHGAAT